MIGRISTGRSFAGAGRYYLHDKDANTSERVAWTQTRNHMTDDPDAALKFMAYTSMNARDFKQRAGGSMAGRKSNGKDVFTFSLSWHPEENPDRAEMQSAAYSALDYLGLSDRQAVLVAHDDTDHKHVHVIANLISHMDGKKHTQSMSKRKLSQWAHQYEQERGKVYCQERAINQQRLKEKQKNVRYRDPQNDHKKQIRELYLSSRNGAEFAAKAREAGYQFGKGKRDFVVLDESGKRYNVARLAPDKTKGVREKFADLKDLQDIDTLRVERERHEAARATQSSEEVKTLQEPETAPERSAEDVKTYHQQKREEAKYHWDKAQAQQKEALSKEQENTERQERKQVEELRQKLQKETDKAAQNERETERMEEFTRKATPEQDNTQNDEVKKRTALEKQRDQVKRALENYQQDRQHNKDKSIEQDKQHRLEK